MGETYSTNHKNMVRWFQRYIYIYVPSYSDFFFETSLLDPQSLYKTDSPQGTIMLPSMLPINEPDMISPFSMDHLPEVPDKKTHIFF